VAALPASPAVSTLDSSPDSIDVVVPSDSEITAVGTPLESTQSVMTIRVAIQRAVPSAAKFVVQRLELGQPLPARSMEAMLVLTGEVNELDLESFAPTRARQLGQAVVGKSREVWSELVTRCRSMISRYGKRALRRVGLTVLPSPGKDTHS
jgi:hypothetical protein